MVSGLSAIRVLTVESSNFDDVDVPGVLLYPGRVLALSHRDPYYVYIAAEPPG